MQEFCKKCGSEITEGICNNLDCYTSCQEDGYYGCQVSIEDLSDCFKKLKKMSVTDNLFVTIDHPSIDGEKVRFMAVVDYLSDMTYYKLYGGYEVVNNYYE